MTPEAKKHLERVMDGNLPEIWHRSGMQVAQAAWDLAKTHYTRRDRSFLSIDVHKEELETALKAERERIIEIVSRMSAEYWEIEYVRREILKSPQDQNGK